MNKTALLEKLTRHPARMETLLAELIEAKVLASEAVVVRPRSLFRRGYSNDIIGFEEVASSQGKKKQADTVMIDVCREGFYDALPEFLFHAPEAIAGYKNLDQRVNESEKVREEQTEARRFFLPFEQEFFRQRIRLELEERKLLSGFSNPMQRAIFDRFWTDVKGIEGEQEAVLFYLLPSAHKIAGNRAMMSSCFELVLQEQVSLEDGPSADVFNSDETPGLGQAALGFDFVTEGTDEEDLPDLEVSIGPMDLENLPDYLEGGKKNNLLSILYSYFVPAEMEVQTHILLKQAAEGFVLDDEDGSARLAFSTYI